MEVDKSDLLKIRDALEENRRFHEYRDLMNAQLHLAKQCRFSPITITTTDAQLRLEQILDESK